MSFSLQLGDVYARTRSLLNDEEATNWTDTKLRTKVLLAFDELQVELMLAGIPIIQSASMIMTVPAMTQDDTNLDLSTVFGYPTDIILPIWMKERQVGQQNRDFVDMIECDYIPNVDIDEVMLRYWSWIQGTILLRGCLTPVQVQLRYQRFLPIPALNTDSVIVPLAQLYLSYRLAALAGESNGDPRASGWKTVATVNLDKVIRANIKQLQDLPAKRRPYHRGAGRNVVLRDF